jgi:hypothetical protein
MGIFDYLSAETRRERRLERSIRGANNKFKPKDYRQIALHEVLEEARKKNEVAIAGLLARYAVVAEPSSEDEQEKDWVFDTLVEIGEAALPQIRSSLRSSESITWVLRTLKDIVDLDDYKKELLELLSDFDIEYERNPDRKQQTIIALAEVPGEDVVTDLMVFLDDVNETVRFQTVAALVSQKSEIAREKLLKNMCEDESIRIRNEIVDAFCQLGWLTTGYKKKVDTILPAGYKQDKSGRIIKLGAAQ